MFKEMGLLRACEAALGAELVGCSVEVALAEERDAGAAG